MCNYLINGFNKKIKILILVFSFMLMVLPALATITSINLVSPSNNTYTNDTTPQLTCNATSDGTLENITFWVWNSTGGLVNNTNITVGGSANETSWNVTPTLNEESYEWNCQAFDNTSSDGNFSDANWTFTVDTTAPTTSASAVDDTGASYTFGTWTSSTYVNVSLSASDSGSGVDTILYCTDTANTCTPNLTYSAPIQITTEGTSYIRYQANDTVGNSETTNNQTIKIDTTSPTTTDNAPTGWQNQPFNITLTCSDTDSGCNLTQYRIDGGSWQNGTLVEITSDGNHSVEYNSTDNVGNTESTNTVYAALDTVAPTITLNSPTSDSILNSKSITINLTATDLNLNYTNISIINSAGSIINSTINSTNGTYTVTLSVQNDGVYNITATTYDLAENSNSTTNSNITVDTTAPNVSKIQPTTGSEDNAINFNATVSDNIGIQSCNLYIDGLNNGTMTISGNTANRTVTFANPGTYSLVANCSDAAGNINDTSVTTVNIGDVTAPTWNETLTNQTVLYETAFSYDVNASDNVAVDNYFINDTTNFKINSSTGLIENNTLLSIGSYKLNISVNDTSGNINWSVITITVQAFPNDHSCSADSECSSGNCLYRVCKPSDWECYEDSHCSYGYCSDGKCHSYGGGGGPAVITPKQSHIWANIAPGATVRMNITKKELGVKQIQVKVKNKANNVELTVTKQEGKPASVEVNVTGKVYKYIKIEAQNLEENNTEKAEIEFEVKKSWINENNIDSNKVYLNRYKNNSWQRLNTTKLSENQTHIIYEAETPGFSYFAVSGEEDVCEEGTKKCVDNNLQECQNNEWTTVQTCDYGCNSTTLECNPAPVKKVCTEGGKRCSNNKLQECQDNAWTTIQTCDYGCNSTTLTCNPAPVIKPEEKPDHTWLVVLIIAAIAGLGYYFGVYKRKTPSTSRVSKF